MNIPEFGDSLQGIEYRAREAIYALIPDGKGKIAAISTSSRNRTLLFGKAETKNV